MPPRDDGERGGAARRHLAAGDALDQREGRGLPVERGQEPGRAVALAFDLHDDAGAVVGDGASQTEPRGQSVHEGPEADALDDPLDANLEPDRRCHRATSVARIATGWR